MELEAAVRRELLRDETVRGYVDDRVWKYRLAEKIDGTGHRAVVIRRMGGWSQPSRVNTQEYPRIVTECFACPELDEEGEPRLGTAEDGAWAVYRAVDKVMRCPNGRRWGARPDNPGLEVLGVQRYGEPTLFGPSNIPKDVAAILGDVRYVAVDWAFQVIHGTMVS